MKNGRLNLRRRNQCGVEREYKHLPISIDRFQKRVPKTIIMTTLWVCFLCNLLIRRSAAEVESVCNAMTLKRAQARGRTSEHQPFCPFAKGESVR